MPAPHPTALLATPAPARGPVARISAEDEAEGWESVVRRAVGLGGDTDTLACIAGAVAEARHGVPAEISARARDFLIDDLRATLARCDSHIRTA